MAAAEADANAANTWTAPKTPPLSAQTQCLQVVDQVDGMICL